MPGVIVSVAVKQGDQVVPGDQVCVLEAMKMQQTLRAEWAGLVREVHVQTGQQMQGGDPIVTLE
jgi:biotin carboxyl carrier protein